MQVMQQRVSVVNKMQKKMFLLVLSLLPVTDVTCVCFSGRYQRTPPYLKIFYSGSCAEDSEADLAEFEHSSCFLLML